MTSPSSTLESDLRSQVGDDEAPSIGAARPVGRAGRFVRRQTKRFMPSVYDPKLHEERGLGWRASWREGAEKLVLQRVPVRGRGQRRFVPRAH